MVRANMMSPTAISETTREAVEVAAGVGSRVAVGVNAGVRTITVATTVCTDGGENVGRADVGGGATTGWAAEVAEHAARQNAIP